jgi:Glycoside hydrolase family 44
MSVRASSGFVIACAALGTVTLACSSSKSPQTGESPGDASTMGPGDGGVPPGDGAAIPADGGEGGPAKTEAGTSPDAGGTCKADCTGKTCGSDGCNGMCGGCPPSQLCSPSFACAAPTTSGIVVDATSQLTPISSGIYGVALDSDDSMNIAALNRWGGDSSGTYNWKNDIFNTGTDWNCANYTGGLFTSPSPRAGLMNSADQFVSYNASKNADTLMTIPITGWLGNVATPNTSPSSCAGATQNTKPCCTMVGTSESVLVDKGSESLDASYMSDWVAHLVSTFGTAANGGVKYYQLDNEPDNWQGLRQDIYPTFYPPGTFCESFYDTIASVGTNITQDFINRTMAYATAVKSADPTTNVLFMSTESPLDLIALAALECGAPGPYTASSSLTAKILALGAQHEASTGQRILDCVDTHYPVNAGLGATQALWRSGTMVDGQTTDFPDIQGWINASYPGTGICVSEYNWPNDTTDTQTAVEEADLLGMFGRLGVRVAAYWTSLVAGTTPKPAYNGMAMFRSYDGKGGAFGSQSIGAASSNAGVDVYAASDSATAPTTLWVMLVNVSGTNQDGLTITVDHFASGGSAGVFRMTNGGAPAADASVTVSGGVVSGFSLPSNSVALLVIPKGR